MNRSRPARRTTRSPFLLLAGVLSIIGLAVPIWAALRRRIADDELQVFEAQRPLLEEAQRKARAAGLDPSVTSGGEDFKVIEGIGPRAEAALLAAGVQSYAQLAELRPGRLRKILRASGGRMSDSRTWPEQARLAAAGEWEALAALQKDLTHGRRRTA